MERFGISRLYHFTHRENISSIGQEQALYSLNELARKGIQPEFSSNVLSRDIDRGKGISDYVRLSFTTAIPMRLAAVARADAELVILEIDPSVLLWTDTLFSLGNAASKTAKLRGDLRTFQQISTWQSPLTLSIGRQSSSAILARPV